ncbi:hypothetical protein WNY37_18365 [Henriciella sp. AS95]|uniref:hypothetical protein n=1 Tax=Henriciella sp. AS95 TaxID=3135782 RepID=UPI00317507DF
MKHLKPFEPRNVLALPLATMKGWTLKRYAILSVGWNFEDRIVSSALQAAVEQLPTAGDILNADTNHGVGFQIIHFAEVAVVAPTFYWHWGSVLSNVEQIRAQWDRPTEFSQSANDVVGCVWEMDIVSFEVAAWKSTILSNDGAPNDRLSRYTENHYLA